MQSPSKLKSDASPLFLDASTVINLVASNRMEEVLFALARPVFVEEKVCHEFKRHPRDGSSAKGILDSIAAKGQLRVLRMSNAQFETFLKLTGCPAPDDLGDGEAATLACADGNGAAVIDDKKASRIAARDFCQMQIYTSLDIVCSQGVNKHLGTAALSDAVYEAIKIARMRVPHHWRQWVSELLGKQRAIELFLVK
jgi:predicted nucleic acid-binding protein